MSDYLERLVERSLGLAEPVLPRPVALFEAPVPSPILPVETEDDHGFGEPAAVPPHHQSAHDPRPVVPPSAPVPRPAPDNSASPEPSPEAARIRPPPADRPKEHAVASVHSVPPLPSDPPVHGRRQVEPPTSLEPRPAPLPPPVRAAVQGSEGQRLQPVSTEPPPPPPMEPRFITRETRVERMTVVERAAAEPGRVAPVLVPPVVPSRDAPRVDVLRPAPASHGDRPLPALPARVERGREPPPASPLSAPAPTIQITIGRLEVRAAAQPPTPSPRARQQSAVMSLDDYLRQRASGSKP